MEHFIYGSPEKAIVYTDMIALTAPKYLNKRIVDYCYHGL